MLVVVVLGFMWAKAYPALGSAFGRQAALDAFQRDHGTVTYRFGSCSRSEMDCSCFVQRLYADRFGRFIPRSTMTQVAAMEDDRVPSLTRPADLVDRNLCVGDLIYTHRGQSWSQGPRHVVVYAGNGWVYHSSSNLDGVGASDLAWLRKRRLYGVYRPLGCSSATSSSPAPSREVQRSPSPSAATADEVTAPVKERITALFRAWEKRDLDLYRRCWSPEAVQWKPNAQRGFDEILDDRQRLFPALSAVRQEHRFEDVTVWGDYAIAEVIYSLQLTFHDGRHSEPEKNVKESYILTRSHGQWRIVHNEIYEGD